MIKSTLVLVIYGIRKLRRFLGLPVLDLTDAKGPLKAAVREMEKPPKAEQPKE